MAIPFIELDPIFLRQFSRPMTRLRPLAFLIVAAVTALPSLSQSGPGAECFRTFQRGTSVVHSEPWEMVHGADTLRGTLYVPPASATNPEASGGLPRRVPALVLLPGGGTDARILMITPIYFAQRLAHCGMAALVYHKRGTGESEGDATTMTMQDVLDDAVRAAYLLAVDARVDTTRMGVMGFSQGGRLAPLVAALNPHIDAAVSVSGPMTSVKRTREYALENSFREAGVRPTRLDSAMTLWNRHLTLMGRAQPDPDDIQALDAVIHEWNAFMPNGLLPPVWAMRERNEIMNSMGQDIMAPLHRMDEPWLALYGADDAVVPVGESLALLHAAVTEAGNDDVDVRVWAGANHGMVFIATRQDTPFEGVIFDWLFARFF